MTYKYLYFMSVWFFVIGFICVGGGIAVIGSQGALNFVLMGVLWCAIGALAGSTGHCLKSCANRIADLEDKLSGFGHDVVEGRTT